MISSIFYFFTFYIFIGIVTWHSPARIAIKKVVTTIDIRKVLMIIGLLTFGVFFVRFTVSQDNTIYTWDWAGYWRNSIDRTNQLFNDNFINGLKGLYGSINSQDYNCYLPSVLALPLHFAGVRFVNYVTVVAVFFLIPALILQALLAAHLLSNKNASSIFCVAIFLGVTYCSFYRALLRGMIDVAILIPITLAIFYLLEFDFSVIDHNRNITVSLLLLLAWLSRRYALFFIVGYVITMLYKAVRDYIKQVDKSYTIIKTTILNFFEIGGVSLIILLIFFRKFFLNTLMANGEAFTSYKAPFVMTFLSLWARSSIMHVAILFISIALCIKNREYLSQLLILLILEITTISVFLNVQTPGVQHVLIWATDAFMIQILLLGFYDKNKKIKVLINALTLLLVTDFMFVGLGHHIIKEGVLTQDYIHYPLVRGDIETINKIVDSINSRTTEENDTYVAVGEALFNSDTLRNVRLPEIMNAAPSESPVSDVDLRDGFPTSFLNAHYVLTCNSPNCTYNNGEEILRYINTEITNTESHIGKHYNLIESYDIDGGLTIEIYERVSDYSKNDLELIAKHFDDVYPHHDELFRDKIL